MRTSRGVSSASVNYATEKATINYDDSKVNEAEFEKTIKDAGYDVVSSAEKLTLHIEGMTCASCIKIVERSLNKATGVTLANVNFAPEKAHIRHPRRAMRTPTTWPGHR